MSTEKTHKTGSALGDLASALDEELRKFERLASAAQRISLDSQENIEKAVRNINQASETQARLGEHVTALVEALSDARVRNDRTAAALQEHRQTIEQSANALGELLTRFGKLGQSAKEISVSVKGFSDLKSEAAGGPEIADPVARLKEVDQKIAELVGDAKELSQAAAAAGISDLAEQVQSLGQQIHAIRGKVSGLEKRFRDKLQNFSSQPS